MLKVQDKAPLFSLPDETGKHVSLKDYLGKKVVLYFYPKDSTPGCTVEACSFRDNMARVRSKGAVVIGVSADSVKSHRTFSDKHELAFPLLSDENREVTKAYGVWKQKSFLGKKFMGIDRTTFIIDEAGTIVHIFPKVKVAGHVDEVLSFL